jgi:transcriptional regulator with XRE-family HTH domain
MLIGERLRHLRQAKHMSQDDIEKRAGLLRCYISRVENGRTVPNVVTLQKLAAAFEVPLWKLFYEGDQSPQPAFPSHDPGRSKADSANDRLFMLKLSRLVGRITQQDRQLLFNTARKMASPQRKRRIKTPR